MKTEEDEAFDELARRQGMWGGGFPAKRAMAADKYSDIVSDGGLDPRNQFDAQPAHCQCTACKDGVIHASDCAVHNAPAYPAGKCDCDARLSKYAETLLEENNMPNTPTARAVYRKMSERIEDDDDIQDYKKPWVGLTDEEIDKTYWRREPFRRPTQFEFARDIEQLLKEKNGV